MLKEAISDTLHENLKTAHQKIDKKWSSATKQIKNVKDRFSIGHFSLKKNQKPEETFKAYDGKNKSSSSVDPIFFNNISFNSPLSEKLNTPTTYEVPRSPVPLNNDIYSEVVKKNVDTTDGIYGKINKIDDADSLVVLRSERNSNEERLNNESWTNSNFLKDFSLNDSCSRSLDESLDSNEPIYANENLYGNLCDMNSLRPDHPTNDLNKTKSFTQEILSEFDPLNDRTLDDWFNGFNHMNLLETLLMEDNYGNLMQSDGQMMDDNISIASSTLPQIPERVDSLGVIVDSDGSTSSVSQEDNSNILVDVPKVDNRNSNSHSQPQRQTSIIIHQNTSLPESVIEPHLAKVDDVGKEPDPIDLSYPKPSKSNWYVDKTPDNFISNNLKENNQHLLPKKQPNKPSVKEDPKPKGSLLQTVFKLAKKTEPKSELMIPKPKVGHQTVSCLNLNFFKLPNTMMQDLLKEFSPRVIDLKNQQLLSYADPEKNQLKEHVNLFNMTSIQCLTNHKFYHEGKSEIHCFELNVAIPKNASDTNKVTKNQSYVYASYNETCRDTLVSKIMRSLTNFPKQICGGIKRGEFITVN
jgi:hypothetical protein